MMTYRSSRLSPRISARHGLATLALLKSNFDERRDHIAMFMPFVLDTIARLDADDFNVHDLAKQIAERHGLRIPTQSLSIARTG